MLYIDNALKYNQRNVGNFVKALMFKMGSTVHVNEIIMVIWNHYLVD